MIQQSLCALMVVWWNISNELHGKSWNNLRDWDLVGEREREREMKEETLWFSKGDVCIHWTVKCHCDTILNIPVYKHLTV